MAAVAYLFKTSPVGLFHHLSHLLAAFLRVTFRHHVIWKAVSCVLEALIKRYLEQTIFNTILKALLDGKHTISHGVVRDKLEMFVHN
jgi:hypothetical protein